MSDVTELAKALNAFQAELVTVGKSASNPFFKSKYAPLDEIMKRAQPVLTKHGLSIMQLPSSLEGQPALTTIVLHTSGELLQATTPLLLAKDDPQGLGSAITYMRRYAYTAALGIVIDEDDDGNRASAPRPAVSAPAPSRSSTKDELATPTQKARIKALLYGRGVVTNDAMLSYLEDNHGIIPGSPMLKTDAANIIMELES